MKDKEFLIWLHERLVNVHKKKELLDYMHKLRCIILDYPEEKETPNDGRSKNSLKELLNKQP
jgi:hypothetical protein